MNQICSGILKKLKKALKFLLLYSVIIFTSNLVVGIVSLFFKMALVTVQGPTVVSVFIEITVFFIAVAICASFVFKKNGKTRQFTSFNELCFHMLILFIIQIFVVFFADFNTLWLIELGTLSLTKYIYLGGISYIESLREIPRVYYLIALIIKDIVFLSFSALGLCHSGINRVFDKE